MTEVQIPLYDTKGYLTYWPYKNLKKMSDYFWVGKNSVNIVLDRHFQNSG